MMKKDYQVETRPFQQWFAYVMQTQADENQIEVHLLTVSKK